MVDSRGCRSISGIFGNRGREIRSMTLDREMKALRRRGSSLSLPILNHSLEHAKVFFSQKENRYIEKKNTRI